MYCNVILMVIQNVEGIMYAHDVSTKLVKLLNYQITKDLVVLAYIYYNTCFLCRNLC